VINAVLVAFFLFLLVFLIMLAGISLCGKVTVGDLFSNAMN
jgi:hypothetical protein